MEENSLQETKKETLAQRVPAGQGHGYGLSLGTIALYRDKWAGIL